jgi:Predicted transcriptional regulator, consists of a Zn-ribbon and ATP-cone domains
VIGARVLEKLREIDEVAYLRYASVYQRFQDVDNSWMPSTRWDAE